MLYINDYRLYALQYYLYSTLNKADEIRRLIALGVDTGTESPPQRDHEIRPHLRSHRPDRPALSLRAEVFCERHHHRCRKRIRKKSTVISYSGLSLVETQGLEPGTSRM